MLWTARQILHRWTTGEVPFSNTSSLYSSRPLRSPSAVAAAVCIPHTSSLSCSRPALHPQARPPAFRPACLPSVASGNRWDGLSSRRLQTFQDSQWWGPCWLCLGSWHGLGAEAFRGCARCTGVSRFHTGAALLVHTALRSPSNIPERARARHLSQSRRERTLGKCWSISTHLTCCLGVCITGSKAVSFTKRAGNLHFPGSLFLLCLQAKVLGSPSHHMLLTPTPDHVSGPNFSSEHLLTTNPQLSLEMCRLLRLECVISLSLAASLLRLRLLVFCSVSN